jgi:hypothetical protein
VSDIHTWRKGAIATLGNDGRGSREKDEIGGTIRRENSGFLERIGNARTIKKL